MRKFLVGAILGALVADNAGASIISRSFLDQALTDYATNTALDLKADKADVTDLSDKIGDAWPYVGDIANGLYNLSWQLYPQEITLENASDLVRFLFGGALESGINQGGVLNILGESVVNTGAYDVKTGQIDDGFRSLLQLTNGWADSEGNTYLGVKGLNDKTGSIETKIGDLPNGRISSFTVGEQNAEIMDFLRTKSLTVEYPRTLGQFMDEMYTFYLHTMFAGWTDTTGKEYGGLIDLNNQIALPSGDMRTSKGLAFLVPSPAYTYPTTIGDSIFQLYSGTLGLSGLADAVYHGNEFMGQTDTTLQVKGLRQITDEIGTLPTEIPNIDSTWARYGFVETPGTPIDLPDTIGEMFAMLFNEDGLFNGLSLRNIMTKILLGFNGIEGLAPLTSAYKLVGDSPIVTAVNANTAKIGTVPDGKNLAGMISETDAKIGTLPSGNFPIFPGYDPLFPEFNQPLTYPTSLAELITAIYGNSETGARGLLAAIITGFPYFDTDGDGSPDELIGLIPTHQSAARANNRANANTTKIGTVPDGKNLAGMISETDAKIGDLPTEYATVGAALTAIKGIAEEAKAAAVAAIPDPKTEGSTGKFVLTVDIVGDNATYRWEKIDREDETTTTTE